MRDLNSIEKKLLPIHTKEMIQILIDDLKNQPKVIPTPEPRVISGSWILNNSRWAFMQLAITFDTNQLLQEAEMLLEFSKTEFESSSHLWKVYPLLECGGFGISDSLELLETLDQLNSFSLKNEAIENMYCWQLAQSLPFEKILAAQFYKLEKGGIIMPHRDNDEPGLTRINFCVNQPKDARTFFIGYGAIPYQTGACFVFDASISHCAVNDSDEDRIYFQVTGLAGSKQKQWENLMLESYLKYGRPI